PMETPDDQASHRPHRLRGRLPLSGATDDRGRRRCRMPDGGPVCPGRRLAALDGVARMTAAIVSETELAFERGRRDYRTTSILERLPCLPEPPEEALGTADGAY